VGSVAADAGGLKLGVLKGAVSDSPGFKNFPAEDAVA